jgi:hypothetical protein
MDVSPVHAIIPGETNIWLYLLRHPSFNQAPGHPDRRAAIAYQVLFSIVPADGLALAVSSAMS